MTTQQDSVDVERLRAALEQIAKGMPQMLNDGTEMHVPLAASASRHIARTALSLPITQRDEQGAKTYADGVEDAAKVCDAYVDVNFEQAGDSVLLDPCLHGKGFTPENVAASERLQMDGLVHSSQAHAGQHLATAIRRLSIEQGDQDGGEG